MGKIQDHNYYVVHGWMISALGLKGIQLQLYAIIFGFAQDGESEFTGSISYLCEFTGATRPTVSNALSELCKKGLLEKREQQINGVTFNRYKIVFDTSKNLRGGKEILQGGVKKFYTIKKIYKEDTPPTPPEGGFGGAYPAPPRKPAEPAVMYLLLNDKSQYPILQSDVDMWKSLYPAVDIMAELRKMAGWLDANPSKRKTRTGVKRFVNSWLSREQDKGAKKPKADEGVHWLE